MLKPIFGQSTFSPESATVIITADSLIIADAITTQLSETIQFIASSSIAITARIRHKASVLLSNTSTVEVETNARQKAYVTLVAMSYISVTAIVVPDTKKSGDTISYDYNLTGTYGIPSPDFAKKRFKYIQIQFTYKDSIYNDDFYSEKETEVVMDNVRRKQLPRQKVSLEKIEGTMAWKK